MPNDAAPLNPTTISPGVWSEWTALPCSPLFSPDGLRETLNGGQMFRWNMQTDGSYLGIWDEHVAKLRATKTNTLEASFPQGKEADTFPALRKLIGLDLPYAEYYAALKGINDAVIRRAMEPFMGLRVVNLPLAESLLCFLCSPMKRIPQIKQVLDNIARAFGQELLPGLFGLPTWERLAEVDEEALRNCKLGYRAKSIADTAKRLTDRHDFLQEVATLPYEQARAQLTQLPGVGGKIADCALLYSGTSALKPFPVDTWISHAMAEWYHLENLNPEQTAQYGRQHFGNLAGLAQQFIFVHARKTTANK